MEILYSPGIWIKKKATDGWAIRTDACPDSHRICHIEDINYTGKPYSKDQAEANADMICKAVNNYERMVDLVKSYYKQLMYNDTTKDYFESHWPLIRERLGI